MTDKELITATEGEYDPKKRIVRFEENNDRSDAEWIEFACTEEEIEIVMQAIGLAISKTDLKESSAGTLLARICKFYIGSC